MHGSICTCAAKHRGNEKKMRGEDGSKRNVARSICDTPLKHTLPSGI